MKELMPFSKFQRIMETLVEFQQKKERISDFFEKEIMEDSWCLITVGTPLEDILINLLADEFECWYSLTEGEHDFDWWSEGRPYGIENDIEYWLYPTSNEEEKSIEINEKKIDITSLESLYDYLVSEYNRKHNLTD